MKITSQVRPEVQPPGADKAVTVGDLAHRASCAVYEGGRLLKAATEIVFALNVVAEVQPGSDIDHEMTMWGVYSLLKQAEEEYAEADAALDDANNIERAAKELQPVPVIASKRSKAVR